MTLGCTILNCQKLNSLESIVDLHHGETAEQQPLGVGLM